MSKLQYILTVSIAFVFYSCQQSQNSSQEITKTTSIKTDSTLTFKQVNNVFNASSPTISKLKKLTQPERIQAVKELLKSNQENGLPLIEKDSLLNGYVYATIMHIDATHQNDITFNIFGIYDEYRFGNKQLYRLDGTDLYYRTYMVPDDLCFSYRLYYTNKKSGKRTKLSDPLNPNLIPSSERSRSSWSAFDLKPIEEKWYIEQNHQQYGTLDTLQLNSKLLYNTRNIYVYKPPGYDNTSVKYPIIYLFDPSIYLNRVEVPNVLENLIKQQKIDPMMAVFVDNPSQSARSKELPLNPAFKDFMVAELLPFIKKNYRVTDLAEETIVGGISYGGLAATYIAFEHDDLFGNVLSQSGSFWRDTVLTVDGSDWLRGDYLTHQFQVKDKRQLKLHLDWRLQENWCKGSGRRMAQVLLDKQYEFKYKEFNGWHDWSNSRKVFPEALMYLLENDAR